VSDYEKDLVILVADKNMEAAVQGLFSRRAALDIRPVNIDIYSHPEHDAGCLGKSHDFLRPMHRKYGHAIVMFDREGCGNESKTREKLEEEVENNLKANGWESRSATIVLDPELEIWVWSESSHVDECLGWENRRPDLRTWLKNNRVGYWSEKAIKPERPKESVEAALKVVRKPRSSSIYKKLAGRVSFGGCTDPAFEKFRKVLQCWFSRD